VQVRDTRAVRHDEVERFATGAKFELPEFGPDVCKFVQMKGFTDACGLTEQRD
jgi:hypothetical protein